MALLHSAELSTLQAKIPEWAAFPFSRDLPNPGIEPRCLALQEDSLQLNHKGTDPLKLVGYWILENSDCNRGVVKKKIKPTV